MIVKEKEFKVIFTFLVVMVLCSALFFFLFTGLESAGAVSAEGLAFERIGAELCTKECDKALEETPERFSSWKECFEGCVTGM